MAKSLEIQPIADLGLNSVSEEATKTPVGLLSTALRNLLLRLRFPNLEKQPQTPVQNTEENEPLNERTPKELIMILIQNELQTEQGSAMFASDSPDYYLTIPIGKFSRLAALSLLDVELELTAASFITKRKIDFVHLSQDERYYHYRLLLVSQVH